MLLFFKFYLWVLPTAGGILGPQVEAGLALVRRVISLVARKMLGPGNTTVRTLHAEKRGACATIFQGKYLKTQQNRVKLTIVVDVFMHGFELLREIHHHIILQTKLYIKNFI